MKNKYGLDRNIPNLTKRLVRQKCGYGCIFCGELFCQYHHFDPDYTKARRHDENKITLLCAKHHGELTTGRISYEKLLEVNKNPFSIRNKQIKYVFADLKYPLEVILGGIVFITPDGILLKADNKTLLSITEDLNGVALLSAVFSTSKGEKILIDKNELVSSVGHWDMESKGKQIKIKDSSKEVVFDLSFYPPHRLIIRKIINYFEGHVIDSEFTKRLYLKSASGASIKFASGFITIGGSLEMNKDRGIIMTGGSLIMGSEKGDSFKGTTVDYLIDQVHRLQEFGALQNSQ